jgi:hypothetical protein
MGLEGRRHSETNRFFCPAAVSHNQVGSQRIIFPVCAFHRGIERLKIDRDVSALHAAPPFLVVLYVIMGPWRRGCGGAVIILFLL